MRFVWLAGSFQALADPAQIELSMSDEQSWWWLQHCIAREALPDEVCPEFAGAPHTQICSHSGDQSNAATACTAGEISSGTQTATQSPRRPLLTPLKALHIDRRQHLELAWKRQQGEEELLKQHLIVTVPTVIEVRTLAHLDQLVDSAGSAIVLLYFYSKVEKAIFYSL